MSDKHKPPQKAPRAAPEQSKRFVEAARELGADVPEEVLNEALRKIGRAPARKRKETKRGQE